MITKVFLTSMLLSVATLTLAQSWQIQSTKAIVKNNPKSYKDNIEMSGKRISAIVYYNIDSLGYLSLKRQLIFPQLRLHIKDNDPSWAVYRAYLMEEFSDEMLPLLYKDDKRITMAPLASLVIDGTIIFKHRVGPSGIEIERQLYPSARQGRFIEEWKLTNRTEVSANIKVGDIKWLQNKPGYSGNYEVSVRSEHPDEITLLPSQSEKITIVYEGKNSNDQDKLNVDDKKERYALLDKAHSNLVFSSPDSVLNTLFAFSKVRAVESIFDSKMGIVHSPGGGRYYAGVWANDQAEYAAPFFPYLGIEDGNLASLNAYNMFFNQMKTIPNHDKNIWASFEMNGDVPCCGDDRGDAAMIAFGSLHFLLAKGDLSAAKEYEPMINWCLTYCDKKKNSDGVIDSQTDEMEGRIPTGTANLSTSCLYYGALDLAIDYYKALNYSTAFITTLTTKKQQLKSAINKYFGANVEGLDTYKYYKEHQNLRHWICLPLVVGIHEKKEATIEALFNRLWSENGVYVEKNSTNPDISKIFWDRATLYALRGTFIAGNTEETLKKLKAFSQTRLLGNRVPYVVEAYPEGNMAHLSAESALYCRVILEGMFGIKPKGLSSFLLTPRLPKDWNEMSLNNVQAFGSSFDITVKRIKNDIEVTTFNRNINKRKSIKILQGGSTVFDLKKL